MKTSKKPKSKPAAKKKAEKKATAHDPQALAIAAIATLGNELAAELKAVNRKLDYLLVRAAPMNREDWPPIVEQAEQVFETAEAWKKQ